MHDYLLQFFFMCCMSAVFVDSLMFHSENLTLPQQRMPIYILSRPISLNPSKNRGSRATCLAPNNCSIVLPFMFLGFSLSLIICLLSKARNLNICFSSCLISRHQPLLILSPNISQNCLFLFTTTVLDQSIHHLLSRDYDTGVLPGLATSLSLD